MSGNIQLGNDESGLQRVLWIYWIVLSQIEICAECIASFTLHELSIHSLISLIIFSQWMPFTILPKIFEGGAAITSTGTLVSSDFTSRLTYWWGFRFIFISSFSKTGRLLHFLSAVGELVLEKCNYYIAC